MSDLLSYSDETGNHSRGRYFVVAGIALDGYHNEVRSRLRNAETNSGKEKKDWHKASPEMRKRYLHECLSIPQLKGRVFYHVYTNFPKSRYLIHTADTLIAAGDHFGRADRWVRAAHEGFTVGARKKLEMLLRAAGDFEVRSGAFRERPEIRLADALCGMLAAVHCTGKGAPYEHLMQDWFVEV